MISTRHSFAPADSRAASEKFLAAACAIADTLLHEAIEWDGKATWVGNDIELETTGALYRASPIGAELYSGTASVAFFLARSSAACGRADYRDFALKACRAAIFEIRSRGRLEADYFTGQSGAVAVLLETLRLCDCAELSDMLIQFACDAEWSEAEAPSDLVGGLAGRIVGLLVLRERLAAWGACSERATDALTQSLQRVMTRVRADGDIGLRYRCGASHGPSGLALAIARAVCAGLSDEAEGLNIICKLFEAEDRCLNATRTNWIDPLRAPVAAEGGQMAWCHGAPGILLLRAEIRGACDSAYESRVCEAATRAVLADVEEELTSPTPRLSLCHGLCGSTLAIETAAESTQPARQRSNVPIQARLGHRIADDVLNGLVLRETAALGLMTGRTGIGCFLLSLGGEDSLGPFFMR